MGDSQDEKRANPLVIDHSKKTDARQRALMPSRDTRPGRRLAPHQSTYYFSLVWRSSSTNNSLSSSVRRIKRNIAGSSPTTKTSDLLRIIVG